MTDRSDTSATRLQHECDTSNTSATWVRHERHERDTSATRVLHERHECDTNATWTARVRHEWKILILITTLVKIYFHTLIFTIWQVEKYLLEMPRSHDKMCLKSAPQKLTFLMAKAMSKRFTLDCTFKCLCTFSHSYAQ